MKKVKKHKEIEFKEFVIPLKVNVKVEIADCHTPFIIRKEDRHTRIYNNKELKQWCKQWAITVLNRQLNMKEYIKPDAVGWEKISQYPKTNINGTTVMEMKLNEKNT